MNTTVRHRPAVGPEPPPSDRDCEERHRPMGALIWRLFGGFLTILLTLALAGAAHLTVKADADDLQRIESRTCEVERTMTAIQSALAEIKVGQKHIEEELTRIRQTLEKETRK